MIHGREKIKSPNYSNQMPATHAFLPRESITVHFSAGVEIQIARRPTRSDTEANASRTMPESVKKRLDDGAEGDTGQTDTDEVGVGAGGRVLAAGNVLLALLVDQILDGDGNEDGDLEVQLGALVEETKTVRAGASTDQVAEGAAEHARVDIGGVTGVGGLVAARELSLVTALGLGLLDGHVIRDREADVGVALVSDTIAVTNTTSRGAGGRESNNGGSEGQDSGESELHCVCGFGFERKVFSEFRFIRKREDCTSEREG